MLADPLLAHVTKVLDIAYVVFIHVKGLKVELKSAIRQPYRLGGRKSTSPAVMSR